MIYSQLFYSWGMHMFLKINTYLVLPSQEGWYIDKYSKGWAFRNTAVRIGQGILFLVSNQTFKPQCSRRGEKMPNCVVGIGRYIDQNNQSKTKSLKELGRYWHPNVPQLRIGQGSKASVLGGSKEAVGHLAGYMTVGLTSVSTQTPLALQFEVFLCGSRSA